MSPQAGRLRSVSHPSLPSSPSHAVAARQMVGGYGGCLAIELMTEASARALPSRLRLFRDATSLGGVESLIEWRWGVGRGWGQGWGAGWGWAVVVRARARPTHTTPPLSPALAQVRTRTRTNPAVPPLLSPAYPCSSTCTGRRTSSALRHKHDPAVSPFLLRLSVGLEEEEHLRQDLERAILEVGGVSAD